MKVSLVVPVYKKTFDQVNAALKTLQTQSHKDIEVIVVFDGPDADLETSIKSGFESDSRFSFHVIEHGGAPKTRNYGLSKATGDVVAFWDADCYAEPEMVKVWVMTFEKNPDVDFVYSGYRWSDTNVRGFESEFFNPWTLKQYNYIASMFPIKREKSPGWDESLEGLQDWDYWRRAVDNGCIGKFVPGFGFATDLPDANSISGNAEKTTERVRKIREKFKDPKSDILVIGQVYKTDAIHIAHTLNANYFANWRFYKTDEYKLVLLVGLHPDELEYYTDFLISNPGCKKAVYWRGEDSESLYCSPYYITQQIINLVQQHVTTHFCDGERTRKLLSNLGVNAEILAYPSAEGEQIKSLPEKFKVLARADDLFKEHLDAIVKSLPMVEITIVQPEKTYDIQEYSLGIQLTASPRLSDGSRNMIMNGRYLISNIQEPFSGFVDTVDVTKFKNDVIQRIVELMETKEINSEGQNYYLASADRSRFAKRIKEDIAVPFEVVS